MLTSILFVYYFLSRLFLIQFLKTNFFQKNHLYLTIIELLNPFFMKTTLKLFTSIFIAFTFLAATFAQAQKVKEVGGAPMYPKKDIIENAVNSKDHTTLVAAVKAAGLVDVLKSKGPFTVFAPVNAAFDKLPTGTVDNLLKPENKDQLKAVLTYHVLAGEFSASKLMKKIKKGNGTAQLPTVQGGMLTFTSSGNNILVTDASGNRAMVTIGDVFQKNGVIHVIDAVLLPKS